MDLAHPGPESRDVTTLERPDRGEKLLAAERARAAERSARTSLDHPRHAANVVVVPVRGDDQHDDPGRIETDAAQVFQGRRCVGATTRIHQDPGPAADVQDDALAVPGTEERDLELIVARGVTGNRHRWNACSVSRAQLRASRKSRSVIRGRSRNTIRDTRFFCAGRRPLVADDPTENAAGPHGSQVTVGDLPSGRVATSSATSSRRALRPARAPHASAPMVPSGQAPSRSGLALPSCRPESVHCG